MSARPTPDALLEAPTVRPLPLRFAPSSASPFYDPAVAPSHGVLIDPSIRTFNAWWRADRCFVTIRAGRTKYPSLTMDLLRARPMHDPACELVAADMLLAAAGRVLDATRARPSITVTQGPECWGLGGALPGDAWQIACALVECWWGNPTGAATLLAQWTVR